MITLIAHAKINLFLDITGKRADGYHLLETVMQSVDLADIVTVELAGTNIEISCSDPTVPDDERNTCHKAARLFYTLLGSHGGAEITLDKRIPHGAGLGGGHDEAAAVLTGLNILHGNPFDEQTMLKLAVKVGADVPFCMVGGTKLCKGIGNIMSKEKPYPVRCFLVVKPSFGFNTKAAYESYDVTMIKRRERHANEYYNVFRAIYKNKELDAIVDRLAELGAEGAELTGSGSAVFGAFQSIEDASDAAKKFPSCFTAVCRPAERGIIQLKV